MELTKEYFDEQLKNLTTKNDLNEVKSDTGAINQRIDALPKRSDLEKFATKDDLLELATKGDLGAVRSDIAEIKQMVQRISEREDQDTRAILHDVADLRKRVTALERSSTPQ
jgi:hypothetical protein